MVSNVKIVYGSRFKVWAGLEEEAEDILQIKQGLQEKSKFDKNGKEGSASDSCSIS
jgi:hypothetical protein